MSGMARRLDALALIWKREGCAVCWHWTPTVLVGTTGPLRPGHCPTCGRVVLITDPIQVSVDLERV